MDGGTWRGLFTNYELRITIWQIRRAMLAMIQSESAAEFQEQCGVVGRMRWNAASWTTDQGG